MSNLKIKIIHHVCGHIQEHVIPSLFEEEEIGTSFQVFDWIDRLEKVPCLTCCRIRIVKAQKELDRLDKLKAQDVIYA